MAATSPVKVGEKEAREEVPVGSEGRGETPRVVTAGGEFAWHLHVLRNHPHFLMHKIV